MAEEEVAALVVDNGSGTATEKLGNSVTVYNVRGSVVQQILLQRQVLPEPIFHELFSPPSV